MQFSQQQQKGKQVTKKQPEVHNNIYYYIKVNKCI